MTHSTLTMADLFMLRYCKVLFLTICLKVETVAPSQVAYKRVAGVIEELSRILQPVREDTTPEHLKTKEENGEGDNGKQSKEHNLYLYSE